MVPITLLPVPSMLGNGSCGQAMSQSTCSTLVLSQRCQRCERKSITLLNALHAAHHPRTAAVNFDRWPAGARWAMFLSCPSDPMPVPHLHAFLPFSAAAVLTNEPAFPDMQTWLAAYKGYDFNSVPGIANAREWLGLPRSAEVHGQNVGLTCGGAEGRRFEAPP